MRTTTGTHRHLLILLGRFSPDDKHSRHRVTIKKRFGLLPAKK
eukprot:IDg7292t1